MRIIFLLVTALLLSACGPLAFLDDFDDVYYSSGRRVYTDNGVIVTRQKHYRHHQQRQQLRRHSQRRYVTAHGGYIRNY